jgi:hypothetical protein
VTFAQVIVRRRGRALRSIVVQKLAAIDLADVRHEAPLQDGRRLAVIRRAQPGRPLGCGRARSGIELGYFPTGHDLLEASGRPG